MQMSKRIHLSLSLIVFLVAIGLPPLPALAQDEPRQPAAEKEQPQQEPQEAGADGVEDLQKQQQETDQTGAATGVTAMPLKKFEPTDKIGADSAVSFPVDI